MRVWFSPGTEGTLGPLWNASGQQSGHLQPLQMGQRICFIDFLSSIKIFNVRGFKTSNKFANHWCESFV